MKRKDQKGPERPRKFGDSAPRYKKDDSAERNFGTGRRKFSDDAPRSKNDTEGRRFSSQKDSPRFTKDRDAERPFGADRARKFSDRDEAPRYKKDGDFERGPRSEGRKFSSPRDTSRGGDFERGPRSEGRKFSSPRDTSRGGDFERGPRSEGRRFSSPKDTSRGGDFERGPRSEGRKFKDSSRGDFRPDRRKFSEEGPREDRGSFRSFSPGSRRNTEGTERDSFRKYDSSPERGKRSFSSNEEQPGKRKFGKQNDPEALRNAGRKKGDPFEYGKGAKPQRRPDYSEENLARSIPEKQRKKIITADKKSTDQIRLNRYIANSGLCSRREADDLIESGQITVNGKTITEMGYQVKVTDVVKYGRKILNPEKLVYVLLNKPKDFITTTEDPEGRRTVMELVAKAGPERIYPVGRLDRATTGLLLFTNDGELAEKLSHPSHEIRKIYQVEIDKPLSREDFDKLVEGVELEDGFIKPDEVSVITPDQQVIGIEIHSGKNRVVRRIFEHLGYDVTQLDRTTYAGLTKKDLPRGNWRFLTEKEVIRLKYMI